MPVRGTPITAASRPSAARRHRLARRLAAALLATALNAGAQTAQPGAAPAPDVRVRISEFRVTGNTLLAPQLLEATLAPFKGERTLAELNQAALAVQALYREAGYGAVVAYLPAQWGERGVATIAVLEGRVARVTIVGNRRVDDANIRRAVPALVEGRTPAVRRIDAQIALANENPARRLALALEAGERPGEVDARLVVTEFPVDRFTLVFDDTGSGSGGRLRATAGWQRAALWDRDHVLSLQLQVAPQDLRSVAVVGASYRAPLYEHGASVELVAAWSDVDGGRTETLAGPLQFAGRGEVLGARLNKSLERRGEVDQRLSLGVDHRAYLNDCSIAGLPPGACGSAGASVAVQPLTLEYGVRGLGIRTLDASVALTRNLALGGSHGRAADFDAVRSGAPRDYTLLRAGLQAVLPLPAAWQLQLRAAGQFSADALVPGEQFGIAGATAVRGYEEREITGDSGVLLSLEAVSPPLPTGAASAAVLRGALFADAGQVRNRLGTPCRETYERCTLAAAGAGLRLSWGRWQGRADVALALEPGSRTARDDVRAHLQLVYRFP